MPQYLAPGIIFARATEANLLVAKSASGGVDADITDRINPVSLASGLITASPNPVTGTFKQFTDGGTKVQGNTGTAFLTQFAAGDKIYYYDDDYILIGTVASVTSNTILTLAEAATVTPADGDTLAVNTNVVVGDGTSFMSDFVAGDYLFYYDSNGSPVLFGRVSITPTNNSVLQLVNKWTTPIVNKYCGKINLVVNGAESFLIRIPAVPNGAIVNGFPTKVFLPNWNSFRITSGEFTSYNDTNVSSISTYSLVGNPSSIGSATQVPYSITPTNIFNSVAKPTPSNPQNRVLWPPLSTANNAAFPNFVFAIFNPYGNNQGENMAQNTMFKFLCAETIQGFQAVANTTADTLIANGYTGWQVGLVPVPEA
jgi:hypothetical protein